MGRNRTRLVNFPGQRVLTLLQGDLSPLSENNAQIGRIVFKAFAFPRQRVVDFLPLPLRVPGMNSFRIQYGLKMTVPQVVDFTALRSFFLYFPSRHPVQFFRIQHVRVYIATALFILHFLFPLFLPFFLLLFCDNDFDKLIIHIGDAL